MPGITNKLCPRRNVLMGWCCLLWVAIPSIALAQIAPINATTAKQSNSLENKSKPRASITAVPSVSTQRQQPPQSQSGYSPKSTNAFDQERVKSINDRIKLIKRLMDRRQNKTAGTDTIPMPMADNNVMTSKGPDVPRKEFDPLANRGELPAEANWNKSDSPIEADQPSTVETMKVMGTPVTAKPIDSFELGNSLFLTGNLKAARKSYESRLETAVSPDEEAWLQCLIGSCYRLEGDLVNAETMYREVVRKKDDSYPVQYARWCLQYVEQKRKLTEQYGMIEAEIQHILTEAKPK